MAIGAQGTAAMARTQSPETSHQAALQLELSGKRERNEAIVLAAVQRNPGMTCGELGRITGLERVGVAPRLTGLFHAGRVQQGARRRCGVQGTNQVTWWAVEQQGGLPL